MTSRRTFLSTLLCLPAVTLIPKLATPWAITGPQMTITPNTEIFWRNRLSVPVLWDPSGHFVVENEWFTSGIPSAI